MSFAQRALLARRRLAVDDPRGEREAVSPVPGSIAYWDNELERPLKGAITLDQSTAERIATALEQIALELAAPQTATFGSGLVATIPQAYVPPPVQPSQPHAAFVGNASLGGAAVWACPIHGGSKMVPAGFSQRTQKPYQAFTVCADSGCEQRPPKLNQLP